MGRGTGLVAGIAIAAGLLAAGAITAGSIAINDHVNKQQAEENSEDARKKYQRLSTLALRRLSTATVRPITPADRERSLSALLNPANSVMGATVELTHLFSIIRLTGVNITLASALAAVCATDPSLRPSDFDTLVTALLAAVRETDALPGPAEQAKTVETITSMPTVRAMMLNESVSRVIAEFWINGRFAGAVGAAVQRAAAPLGQKLQNVMYHIADLVTGNTGNQIFIGAVTFMAQMLCTASEFPLAPVPRAPAPAPEAEAEAGVADTAQVTEAPAPAAAPVIDASTCLAAQVQQVSIDITNDTEVRGVLASVLALPECSQMFEHAYIMKH